MSDCLSLIKSLLLLMPIESLSMLRLLSLGSYSKFYNVSFKLDLAPTGKGALKPSSSLTFKILYFGSSKLSLGFSPPKRTLWLV